MRSSITWEKWASDPSISTKTCNSSSRPPSSDLVYCSERKTNFNRARAILQLVCCSTLMPECLKSVRKRSNNPSQWVKMQRLSTSRLWRNAIVMLMMTKRIYKTMRKNSRFHRNTDARCLKTTTCQHSFSNLRIPKSEWWPLLNPPPIRHSSDSKPAQKKGLQSSLKL